MTPFIRTLYEKMDLALKEILPKGEPILLQAEESARVCRDTLKELRQHIIETPFKASADEIHFFKEVQPKFYCRFIYHVKVFTIETNRPIGSKKAASKHLQNQLRRIQYFFRNNLDLYKYYRTGLNHLDELYFTRDQYNVKLLSDDLTLTVDQDFCTLQSYKLAKLLANEMLQDYIQQELSILLNNKHASGISSPSIPFEPMRWSATKASLMELIFALQCYGAFNNGQAKSNEIVLFFEQACQINLGNFHRTLYEIRLRKKGRTSFLRQLIEMAEKRMDEMDENSRF